MKLELYYYDQCPFCQMVLREVQSLKLEAYIELKNTLTDRNNAQVHGQKTGRTTVPCLYIDNEPMFESSDINIWLNKNASKIKGL